MVDHKVVQDSFKGCLLAGAAGDALGYPIEFWSEAEIDARFGVAGIQTLAEAAELGHADRAPFSDDTQMTLFTAAALEMSMGGLAKDRRTAEAAADDALFDDDHAPAALEIIVDYVWDAYLGWLATQGDSSRLAETHARFPSLTNNPLLNYRRAPGNTCLSALKTSEKGGRTTRPVNHSKGCGGVMRVAPVGLMFSRGLSELYGMPDPEDAERLVRFAAQMSAEVAALTHGHPMGWLSAAALGAMISLLSCVDTNDLGGASLPYMADAALQAADVVCGLWLGEPCATELWTLLQKACDLALDNAAPHTPQRDRDNIHQLGEGWVGEEALAIAVYAALAHHDDIAAALRCAVNHKGDADSTGAICGNLLGAFWGAKVVSRALDVDYLEGAQLVLQSAGTLRAMMPHLFHSLYLHKKNAPAAARVSHEAADEKQSDVSDFHAAFRSHDVSATAPEPAGSDAVAADPSVPRFVNPREQPTERRVSGKRLASDEGMPYTPATKRALKLSFEAHRNQHDKSGLPYVYHPFHLADQMRDEVTACAALLHDVVEDGHFTFAQLEEAGIPQEAVDAVRALTHDPSVPYMRYVLGLREQPVARAVKLADLRHNANLSRLDKPGAKDCRRRVKYLIAMALLDDSGDEWDGSLGHWRKRIPLDAQEGRHDWYLSVFYRPDGTWEKLSIDHEVASDSHYDFDAQHAEALRKGLGGAETLPEALAEALEGDSVWPVLNVMCEQGIPWQEFHYD